ncbi:MAG: hypothetical protein GX825_10875, partial [Syntrophomonadaceae bacterium]|nr:hypothetical protein [Syntrophomonadaceae bacterium]
MEKNYAFKNRLFKVHQENRRNDKVWQKIKGTVIDDSWEIIYQDDSPVVENAALDLLDYFRTSMDLYPHLKKTEQVGATANKIIYEIDKAISGYKIIVDDFIKLLAGTDRMLAQASYALEEEMNFNEGPVLKKGTIQRDSIFSPRMTHSGFELDKFPDEHLLQIAHSGMDSLLLFVDGINISFNGFNDFNELIQRAALYGLDVYVYSHLKSNLH